MLHVAEAFIEKSYHPTVICRGILSYHFLSYHRVLFIVLFSLKNVSFSAAYNKALEDAIAVLDKIAMSIDVNDRKSTCTFVFDIFSAKG